MQKDLFQKFEDFKNDFTNFFEKSKKKAKVKKHIEIQKSHEVISNDKQNKIIVFLKELSDLNQNSENSKFFDWQYRNAKEVDICKNDLNVKFNIKKNECFKNAFDLAISEDCKYVEGYIIIDNQTPLNHAWNKIGEEYYDITLQKKLGSDIKKVSYVSVIEIDASNLIANILDTDKHCSLLLNEYQKSITKSEDEVIFNDVMTSFMKNKKFYSDVLVVNENGLILLLKRNAVSNFEPNKWWLPGGKIENNEDSKIAAQRELLEETNISKESLTLLNVEDTIDSTIYTYFVDATFEDGVIIDPNEHFSFEWVNIDSLNNYEILLNLGDKIKELYKLYQYNKAYNTLSKAFDDDKIDLESYYSALVKVNNINNSKIERTTEFYHVNNNQ